MLYYQKYDDALLVYRDRCLCTEPVPENRAKVLLYADRRIAQIMGGLVIRYVVSSSLIETLSLIIHIKVLVPRGMMGEVM